MPFESRHFKESEFTCKCGCGLNNIDPSLVSVLDKVRDALDRPLIINCGTRCPKHNEDVGGEKDSAHLTGLAADIKVTDSRMRFVLRALLMKYFFRIGTYPTFLHVDIDTSKPQFVEWLGK